MTQRFINYHKWETDLFRNGARLWGLVQPLTITQPSFVQINGYVNIRHKGAPNVVVGISSRIGLRTDTTGLPISSQPTGTAPGSWNTANFTWVAGAKDGKNILGLSHHYETLMLSGALILQPGVYRIEPYLFEMSALAPNQDGITCVNVDTGQANNDTFGFMSVVVDVI